MLTSLASVLCIQLSDFLSTCSLIPALSSAYKTISMARYAQQHMSDALLSTSVQTNLPHAEAVIGKESARYDAARQQVAKEPHTLIHTYTR